LLAFRCRSLAGECSHMFALVTMFPCSDFLPRARLPDKKKHESARIKSG